MEAEYSNVTGRRLKPCKPGQERNPKTNRCRKALPPCPAGSMRNPKTNRCKKIPRGPSAKVWCDVSQLEARRLILRVGLGRDLVPGDLSTARKPNRLCDTLTKMLRSSCTKGWKVTKFVAAGGEGHIFRAVRNDGTEAVMKVQIGSAKAIRHEVKTQKHFHSKGLAPKILAHCSFKPKNRLGLQEHNRLNELVHDSTVPFRTEGSGPDGNLVHIVIMEEVADVIGNWLRRPKSKEQLGQLTLEIIKLITSFRDHKLTHGDLHLDNIGYVYTDASKRYMKLLPIDFGRSYVGKAHTSLEIGALMRILRKVYQLKKDHRHPVPDYNRRVMMNLVRKLARTKFGITLRKSLSEVEERYLSQLYKYLDEFNI
jgi:hypothetical protein